MGWIRSKPIYRPLEPVPGAAKYIIASIGEEGAHTFAWALPDLAMAAEVLHLHAGAGCPPTAEEQRSVEFLLSRLRGVLLDSSASTVLAAAGPEQAVWQCCRVGRACGLPPDRVLPVLAGSAARTVYCVHCKTLTSDVVTSTFACSGCGLTLFVRDHFSRLLAAYAGVRVDAEVPGDVPKPEVLYA